MTRHGVLLAALITLLSACAQQSTHQSTQPVTGGAKRPTQDGAPTATLDPSTIVNAKPRHELLKLAGNMSPYTVNGKQYHLVEDHRGFRQRGTASWYGTKFHGLPTSNGEIYSLYEMTAAHKTLPIPLYVRVTNLNNNRSAIVRVNDRGPFHSERIIDLSYAAAVKLGFADQGTAPVEIEVIEPDNSQSAAPTARYYLQVAAFAQRASALNLEQSLRQRLDLPVTVAVNNDPERVLHRVRIGPFSDFPAVQAAKRQLQQSWNGEPSLIVEDDH